MLDVRGICSTKNEKPCRKCKALERPDMERPASYDNPSLYKGSICDRCLGYGKVAYTTITFKKLNGKDPLLVGGLLIDFSGGTITQLSTGLKEKWHASSTFKIGPYRANEYWHIFDTHERMPIQSSKLDNLRTAEVV
jgi:hypothetical protein